MVLDVLALVTFCAGCRVVDVLLKSKRALDTDDQLEKKFSLVEKVGEFTK